MPQTKRQIQSLLEQVGASPRHRFGQNFMIDGNLVRAVADAGEVHRGDRVIEVGPGTGTLTEELLARGARVLAVEIDRDLASLLRQRLGGEASFELIEADVLDGKHELCPPLRERIAAANADRVLLKLVANLPYQVASPLIVELLLAGVGLLAFTVQKEVAERLSATAGSEGYGPLTVMAQVLGEVEVLRPLPPQAFWPAPRIESALVRIRRRTEVPTDAAAFGGFVRRLFGYRRKTLRRALVEAGHDAPAVLNEVVIDGQRRPETLDLEELLSLFRARRGENAI